MWQNWFSIVKYCFWTKEVEDVAQGWVQEDCQNLLGFLKPCDIFSIMFGEHVWAPEMHS